MNQPKRKIVQGSGPLFRESSAESADDSDGSEPDNDPIIEVQYPVIQNEQQQQPLPSPIPQPPTVPQTDIVPRDSDIVVEVTPTKLENSKGVGNYLALVLVWTVFIGVVLFNVLVGCLFEYLEVFGFIEPTLSSWWKLIFVGLEFILAIGTFISYSLSINSECFCGTNTQYEESHPQSQWWVSTIMQMIVFAMFLALSAVDLFVVHIISWNVELYNFIYSGVVWVLIFLLLIGFSLFVLFGKRLSQKRTAVYNVVHLLLNIAWIVFAVINGIWYTICIFSGIDWYPGVRCINFILTAILFGLFVVECVMLSARKLSFVNVLFIAVIMIALTKNCYWATVPFLIPHYVRGDESPFYDETGKK